MINNLEKLYLIKKGDLTLYGFDPINHSGFYEIDLKYNTYTYVYYLYKNNKVYTNYLDLFSLTKEERSFLIRQYPKTKRIKKGIYDYIQRFSLLKIRDRKLKKLLNEY